MGGKRFVFPDECYDWWNALPRTLEWTDEPPKVPGWYWYKTSSHLGITKFPELCDRTREGWQWAGPIPEPVEPKE
jgi:hypothetical protein